MLKSKWSRKGHFLVLAMRVSIQRTWGNVAFLTAREGSCNLR